MRLHKCLIFVFMALILVMGVSSFAQQPKAKLPQSAYLKSAKIAILGNPPRYNEALGLLDTMLYYYGPIPEGYFLRGNIYAEYAEKENDINKKFQFFEKMSASYDSMFTSCGNKDLKKNLTQDCKKFTGVVDSIRTSYWGKNYNEAVKMIDNIDTLIEPRIKAATDSAELEAAKAELKASADSAKELFQIATTIDGSRFRAYEGVGLIYDRLKQYDSSLVWFKKASDIVPDSNRIIQNIAYAYIQLNDWDNAIAYFKKYLVLVPTDAGTIFNVAVCYSNKHENDSAYAWDMKAIAADPNQAGAYIDAGQYFLVKAQTFSDSIKSYRQKDDKSPEAAKFEKIRDAMFDTSATYFANAAKLEPENVQVLKQYGVVLLVRGEYDKSVEVFKKLTELEPGSKDNWINIGDIYIQQQKFADAIAPFEKATEIDPGDVKLWEVLKDLYTNNNFPEKAKAAEAKIADLKKM